MKSALTALTGWIGMRGHAWRTWGVRANEPEPAAMTEDHGPGMQ